MASDLLTLEDRLLILKDKVDVAKAFDPNQLRDALGRWAESGASGVGSAARSASSGLRSGVQSAGVWFARSKVRRMLPDDLSGATKDAVSQVLATMITHKTHSNIDDELVKTTIRHLSTNLRITAEQAKAALKSSMQALRRKRKEEIAKAKGSSDPVLEVIDKILALLNEKDLTKLEDRLLVLRDRVDVVRTTLKG